MSRSVACVFMAHNVLSFVGFQVEHLLLAMAVAPALKVFIYKWYVSVFIIIRLGFL